VNGIPDKTFRFIAAPHMPMDAEANVRPERIEDQADLLVRNGVGGAFICGTTGEGPSLTTPERKAVVEQWTRIAPEGFRLIVQVGHQSFRETCDLARHAADRGAGAVAVMPPTFFRPPGTAELADWLARVADAAPLPLYYYHIPSMTGTHVAVSELFALAGPKAPNLRGIKFTHTDLVDYAACLALDGGRYECLFGVDEMLLSAVAIGAAGAVGTTYNFAAPLYRRMIEVLASGDTVGARERQHQSIRMVATGKRYGNFTAVSKAMMRIIGLDLGPVRPPLKTLADDDVERLARELSEMGFMEFCCK